MATFGRTRTLAPHESETVQLSFSAANLAVVDDMGNEVLLAGSYHLRFDDGSGALGSPPPLECAVVVPATRMLSPLPPPLR